MGFAAPVPFHWESGCPTACRSASVPFTGEMYFLPSGSQKGESVISCFKRDRKAGQSISLALAVSSATLIQNNQYASVTYLGAACPSRRNEMCWECRSSQ